MFLQRTILNKTETWKYRLQFIRKYLYVNVFFIEIVLYLIEGNPINVYKSQSGANNVINKMEASDEDAKVDGDTIRYKLVDGPRESWIHKNTLFALNTGLFFTLANVFFTIYLWYTPNKP